MKKELVSVCALAVLITGCSADEKGNDNIAQPSDVTFIKWGV